MGTYEWNDPPAGLVAYIAEAIAQSGGGGGGGGVPSATGSGPPTTPAAIGQTYLDDTKGALYLSVESQTADLDAYWVLIGGRLDLEDLTGPDGLFGGVGVRGANLYMIGPQAIDGGSSVTIADPDGLFAGCGLIWSTNTSNGSAFAVVTDATKVITYRHGNMLLAGGDLQVDGGTLKLSSGADMTVDGGTVSFNSFSQLIMTDTVDGNDYRITCTNGVLGTTMVA